MSENPRLVKVGTISGGSVAIQADVRSLGSAVAVTLLVDYQMLGPDDPMFLGFPFRPSFTGAAIPQYPHLIPSGTSLTVLQCEATALINSGAATLA